MKQLLTYLLFFAFSTSFACGNGGWEGMNFYNLFMQTNISAEEFYPFLRDEQNAFYGENYYYKNHKKEYPKGNVKLWNELLTNWNTKDIEKAVYQFKTFAWNNKNTKIEKKIKKYLAFAQQCSEVFSYRIRRNSWDYDEVLEEKTIDTKTLLSEANILLSKVSNEQLKMRYYYQIIRILHYSKDWKEAISLFETKIENRYTKNEIYYYIVDQVAGCYYSTENIQKAAYLFTKVLNKSIDRKKSAFTSFNYCVNKNVEGTSHFKNIEDEKDLLLIKSLRNFTDEINNINKFITLDASDNRIELLFMRALSNVERTVWPKYSYGDNYNLPMTNENEKTNQLLKIAEQQVANLGVKNNDFWKISSSYLSFIQQDVSVAKNKLRDVNAFTDQKKKLAIIYEVFTWKEISKENENYLSEILKDNPIKKIENEWYYDNENDWRHLIVSKIAHTYYKNNKIAKSFLVHNFVENTNNINSIDLLDALESFYYKSDKSDYEKQLLVNKVKTPTSFMDYINYQKGIYYLYQKEPSLALTNFEKNQNFKTKKMIPNTIFSNNIKECFNCSETYVMEDEVYKASVFSSFIKTNFSRKELAENLIALEKLTTDEKKWKRKLAHYLLGNYYYNISNTGYYRGLLTGDSNCCDYRFITYASDKYGNNNTGENIIATKRGYNLSNINFHPTKYFNLSEKSKDEYQKVIELSTDKELNARCLYLMAKCELNTFYNVGSKDTFEIKFSKYFTLELPNYKSFKTLKEEYSDTKFHDMIIKECSYFRLYSAHY